MKLALDSKKVNKFIHKNKYQMPNIDLLLKNIAQVVESIENQQTLFSTLDLRSYSQIPLEKPHSRTMQLQFDRLQCYRNLPIPNWILRPHGHAG